MSKKSHKQQQNGNVTTTTVAATAPTTEPTTATTRAVAARQQATQVEGATLNDQQQQQQQQHRVGDQLTTPKVATKQANNLNPPSRHKRFKPIQSDNNNNNNGKVSKLKHQMLNIESTRGEENNDQPNICAGCSRPIKERYLLMALDKQWHEDCLKCACCDCRLGEVGSSLFTHANKILCRRDFLRIFGQQGNCAACKRLIPPYELVMRAQDHAYHMECFACQSCQYRFCVGDRFHLNESHKITCLMCYTEQQQQQQQPHSNTNETNFVDDSTNPTTTTQAQAQILETESEGLQVQKSIKVDQQQQQQIAAEQLQTNVLIVGECK